MENGKQYSDFAINDFLFDESFQDWIIHPDAEKDRFWQQLLFQYPDKEPVIASAKEILFNLDFKVNLPAPGKAQQSLEKTLALIDSLKPPVAAQRSILIRFNKMWRATAILIVSIGLGILAYTIYNTPATNEVATGYGKLDTLSLPDQSTVVLNANSSVRYQKDWIKGKPREVWLEGEAFFSVKHLDTDGKIERHERFIVHVQEVSIEVLGTAFNVRERRGKTEIVLQQGSIKVSFANKKQEDIVMKPGEIVIIDSTAKEAVSLTTTNPGNYTAWKAKRLLLNNPTLQEITNYLEDTYGKKFVLRNPQLANKRVNGPILIDSLEDALFVISTVLNVSITEDHNTLIVESR